MTITQTVEIPDNHRLIIDVPREIPAGKVKVEVKLTPVVEKNADQTPGILSAGATPHADALLEILSKIGGNINPDEIRTERLAKKPQNKR